MIWQPKLFLYKGNNFNHQYHLKIIKIKDIFNLFMNSSSNHYYSLSIVYSNQYKFIILLHKIMIKMYIDDDSQKEKTIIPSLDEVDDFLWVDPTVFSFWNLKTRSLIFSLGFLAVLRQKALQNLNTCLITTSFNSRKLPWTLSNFLECFQPIKYLKIQDFKLKLSFLFHSLTNTLFYSIFTPKALFLSQISSLFSFSSFLWNFLYTITLSKFQNQRKRPFSCKISII